MEEFMSTPNDSKYKKIAKGEKWETPKELGEVFVKYEVQLENGIVVSQSDGAEFAVKDGYFYPALPKAVKTLKKGKKVLLTVKPPMDSERLVGQHRVLRFTETFY